MLKERVVVAHQVVNVVIALLAVVSRPARSLGGLGTEDETFVRNGLHVVLVRVAGAEERVLQRDVVHGVAQDGGLDLCRVVEPLDLDPHVPHCSLPHGVDPPDVGSVGPACGEKDSAVSH